MGKYVLGIDQSTQGTKALLFDQNGHLLLREDLLHKQIVNELGWVSHDLKEIYQNTIQVVKNLILRSGIDPESISSIGISNQRETSAIWNRQTGEPFGHAVVWQCARAEEILLEPQIHECRELIEQHTGLKLSPYFPAAKFAWLLKNQLMSDQLGQVCFGTMDTWLLFKLTHGASYKTDYSNASRTQLFNIHTLQWDHKICDLFHIPINQLAEVCDSNAYFGETDFEGILPHKVPIQCMMGDSHASLFGQGCVYEGMVKATYGTGSSVMMNIGDRPLLGKHGVVTSLGWGIDGKVTYVMEGNVNYTGAVITWLKDKVGMIANPSETEMLAKQAVHRDELYFIPAFTGLGAPYWDSNARASYVGIDRSTGRAELVRASLESIAYQITDILEAIRTDTDLDVTSLRVDGGPSRNQYLMQFQSDMIQSEVEVSEVAEISGSGVAYLAGITAGIYDWKILNQIKRTGYIPTMQTADRDKKFQGWKRAVATVLK